MNDFLSALPWRLAALAALIVGGLSVVNGVDTWVGLERCGFAFLVFWALGSFAKGLLRAAEPRRPARVARPSGTRRLMSEDQTAGDQNSRAA
jgi:hypothetical protein